MPDRDRYPKPLSTLSDLNRTDSSLTVRIRPLAKNKGCAQLVPFLIFAAILINLIVISVTLLVVYTAFRIGFASAIVFLLLLFPWRVTFDFNRLFVSLFSQINVSINTHDFRINSDCLGIKHHHAGRTQELKSIEVVAFKPLKKILPYESQLCLRFRDRSYKFGLVMFRPEQVWLAGEINDFLEFARRDAP